MRSELWRVDGSDPGAGQPIAKHRKMAASPLRFLRGSARLTVDCQRRMHRSLDMVLDEAVWAGKH